MKQLNKWSVNDTKSYCSSVQQVLESTLLPTNITLSRRKWSFLNLGAVHCLKHLIESNEYLDIYCLNDPEYLSARYLAILDITTTKTAGFFEQLNAKNWFVSILSDRGNLNL